MVTLRLGTCGARLALDGTLDVAQVIGDLVEQDLELALKGHASFTDGRRALSGEDGGELALQVREQGRIDWHS